MTGSASRALPCGARLAICMLAAVLLTPAARASTSARPIRLTLSPYAGTALRTVDVTVSGHTDPFIFDTGGGLVVLTPAETRIAGCSPFGKVTGFRADGGRISAARCGPVTLDIGSYRSRLEVAEFDFSKLLGRAPPVAGILGLAAFERHVITFDYAHSRVTVETGRSLARRIRDMHPVHVRIARDASGALDPFIEARAQTGTLWLEVDSGNNGPVFLAPHAQRQLGISIPAHATQPLNLDVIGLGSVPVTVASRKLIYDGQLDPAFLHQIVLTVDLAHGRAWARFNSAASGDPAAGAPPPTARHPVVTVMHGVTVRDPYRWLENAADPKVQAWIDAQNAYADRLMGHFKDASAIAARVRQLAITGTQQFAPQLVNGTLFFMRETPPQAQPVLVAQAWPNGAPRVLVDPNPAGGHLAIQEVWPSPSGRYVAYGTADNGSEATTLHVVDAATGKVLADALTDAGGGTTGPVVAWDASERGFTYGRLPHGSPFGISLYHHALGSAQSRDRPQFGQGLSPVAEYQLLTSADAREAAALVQFGDGTPYRVYLRTGHRWRPILGAEAGVTAGAFDGDRLLLVAFRNADHGRILAVSAAGSVSTLVAPQKSWVPYAVSAVRGGFLVTQLWGPDWRVDQYTQTGRFVRRVPLPRSGIGIDAVASEARSPSAVIAYSGWSIPSRWGLYDTTSGSVRTVFAVRPPDPDYANIRVRRLTAISKDGTHIPVTLLALKSTPRRADDPAILTAYGGFDIPVAPQFIGTDLAWLERGGIYAVANIRGGDEFGEAWHRQGRLTDKQHVFDDFAAAAHELIAAGWTSPSHLGIIGGSNGGLLMGAALTQHPHRYRAVVSFVGIYDMLRHQLFANGRYNESEYGSTADPAQFRALYAYSPYYDVHPRTRYPAVLLETGENDARVAPWQSRKFAAALQAATTSELPVLLLTRRAAGHGNIGASFDQRVGNAAAALIFFANELR